MSHIGSGHQCISSNNTAWKFNKALSPNKNVFCSDLTSNVAWTRVPLHIVETWLLGLNPRSFPLSCHNGTIDQTVFSNSSLTSAFRVYRWYTIGEYFHVENMENFGKAFRKTVPLGSCQTCLPLRFLTILIWIFESCPFWYWSCAQIWLCHYTP